ncbi:type IV secretory system conjugative DNA transfer family protein [Nocardioides sp. J2M5]|uniref:type IV secretory system conjugative DNA transfer family protein n=1 Tax=Nocardioides palaemonis TaxID=2829810 RepID=UPI001BA8B9DD|nr:TraM recognition domain-containing protein [Nocardioides palaemonis]MBS2938918.1 type IV secretory system conjugative DNA transfer family protein [Nocardioides palaemonis]
MAINSGTRGADDALVNLGLIAIGAAVAMSALLRGAGSIAASLSGVEQPREPLSSGMRVLAQPGNPSHALDCPDLSSSLYWAVVGTLLIAGVVVAWTVLAWAGRVNHRRAADPRRIPGIATRRDVDAAAGAAALLRRAAILRPSLARPRPADVGYLLGHSCGRQVWASVEDSILIVGPPRSGKGLHLVINAILDAPGAVVTTSTRPDNIAATLAIRSERGPVAVFDPQSLTAGLPGVRTANIRWSPVRGCEEPLTAMTRAAGLAASTGLSSGGVESGGFWEGKTRTALQALLHAAALEQLSTRTLLEWSLSPSAAGDAVGILSSRPRAATGWSDALQSIVTADARTRDSIWMGVSQSLASLADPRVLDAVSPQPGEHFDPTEFLTNDGTLYLLATGAGSGASWPLVAALVEDIAETARRIASTSRGSRLDPPVLLALDEIGNLAPLPSLPVLMAEGGGTGITTMPVLQSLAQARSRWGDHAASTIWDASIAKVILGGASASKDLQELSVLIGEREEATESHTIGEYGARSRQRSTRRVSVIPPERIRTLPFGAALVLLRSAPPVIADLRPWTKR